MKTPPCTPVDEEAALDKAADPKKTHRNKHLLIKLSLILGLVFISVILPVFFCLVKSSKSHPVGSHPPTPSSTQTQTESQTVPLLRARFYPGTELAYEFKIVTKVGQLNSSETQTAEEHFVVRVTQPESHRMMLLLKISQNASDNDFVAFRADLSLANPAVESLRGMENQTSLVTVAQSFLFNFVRISWADMLKHWKKVELREPIIDTHVGASGMITQIQRNAFSREFNGLILNDELWVETSVSTRDFQPSDGYQDGIIQSAQARSISTTQTLPGHLEMLSTPTYFVSTDLKLIDIHVLSNEEIATQKEIIQLLTSQYPSQSEIEYTSSSSHVSNESSELTSPVRGIISDFLNNNHTVRHSQKMNILTFSIFGQSCVLDGEINVEITANLSQLQDWNGKVNLKSTFKGGNIMTTTILDISAQMKSSPSRHFFPMGCFGIPEFETGICVPTPVLIVLCAKLKLSVECEVSTDRKMIKSPFSIEAVVAPSIYIAVSASASISIAVAEVGIRANGKLLNIRSPITVTFFGETKAVALKWQLTFTAVEVSLSFYYRLLKFDWCASYRCVRIWFVRACTCLPGIALGPENQIGRSWTWSSSSSERTLLNVILFGNRDCPIQPWQECSVTCGEGIQTRPIMHRDTPGSPCTQTIGSIEIQKCAVICSTTKYFNAPAHCGMVSPRVNGEFTIYPSSLKAPATVFCAFSKDEAWTLIGIGTGIPLDQGMKSGSLKESNLVSPPNSDVYLPFRDVQRLASNASAFRFAFSRGLPAWYMPNGLGGYTVRGWSGVYESRSTNVLQALTQSSGSWQGGEYSTFVAVTGNDTFWLRSNMPVSWPDMAVNWVASTAGIPIELQHTCKLPGWPTLFCGQRGGVSFMSDGWFINFAPRPPPSNIPALPVLRDDQWTTTTMWIGHKYAENSCNQQGAMLIMCPQLPSLLASANCSEYCNQIKCKNYTNILKTCGQ